MDLRNILSVTFNQDHSLFACASENGFKIFNVDPLVERAHETADGAGSVARIEMMRRSNIVAFIPGGTTPKFPENVLVLFDESATTQGDKFLCDIACSQPILSAKLKRDKIVVVLRNEIHIFSFPDPITLLKTLETRDNPVGLCELSPSLDKNLLVFPGPVCGSVQFLDLNSCYHDRDQTKAPVTVTAHENELACISVNQQGTMIATASRKGTIIRVFDTLTTKQLNDFRRGSDSAKVYCLTFSHDSSLLCAASDKGTVHIFCVKDPSPNVRHTVNNAPSIWSVGPERSRVSFTVASECPCICAFGPNHSVYAICVDGTFHKYVFYLDGKANKETCGKFWDGSADDVEF